MTKRRTIIRAAHGEQPYFLMLRSVAQNTALSYDALGLLAHLLSKPNDWEVYPDTLKRTGTGRAAVYKLLKELREAGHVQRVIQRDDKKKIIRFEYVIYEHPLPEGERDLLPKKQEVAFQDIEKLQVGNRHNTEYRQEENKERETDALSELPDHLTPAQRRTIEFPSDVVRPNGDGGTAAYQIGEAYCDAWSINVPKRREAVHHMQGRYAKELAAFGATPEDVLAMCKAKRDAGKQPDEYGLRLVQMDWAGWKTRTERATPAKADRTEAEKAAADAELEAERRAWQEAQGLA